MVRNKGPDPYKDEPKKVCVSENSCPNFSSLPGTMWWIREDIATFLPWINHPSLQVCGGFLLSQLDISAHIWHQNSIFWNKGGKGTWALYYKTETLFSHYENHRAKKTSNLSQLMCLPCCAYYVFLELHIIGFDYKDEKSCLDQDLGIWGKIHGQHHASES